MFVVELKNKFRLPIDGATERVTSKDNETLTTSLQFDINHPDFVTSIDMNEISKQFVPDNLSLIKIYPSETATEPTVVYTKYKTVSVATKDIFKKTLTISLLCDDNAE